MPKKLPLITKLSLKGRTGARLAGTCLAGTSCRRRLFWCLVVAMLAVMSSVSFAKTLVAHQTAARLGLQRSWFAQIRVDSAVHKVAHWLLDKDQLFALTTAGAIQSIDAETGKTLWTTEVGAGHDAAAGIAVNAKYVAVLGSGRFYLFDRTDGHHLWSRQVGGAPSAAPALSKNYAYVVLLSGRVEGYRLDDPSAPVWQYQSHGRTFQSPTAIGKVVSWPTDSGMLYVGEAESPRLLFRVETNDEIVAPPAEQDPYLFVGSLDGYLYCFHELTGSEAWRYATGFAITVKPAVVGNKAFVASDGPSLHAVEALTGQPLWQLEGASQFVALGNQHTYAMDRFGTLIVVDNESGGIAGRLATGVGNSALVNDQSDRIFVVNDRGLVQCLHEIGATQPTWHRQLPQDDELASETETDETEDASDEDALGSGTKQPEPQGEIEDSDENPFESDGADDPNPFESGF